MVDDLLKRMASGVREGPMFKNMRLPKLTEKLRDQFCVPLGGPVLLARRALV